MKCFRYMVHGLMGMLYRSSIARYRYLQNHGKDRHRPRTPYRYGWYEVVWVKTRTYTGTVHEYGTYAVVRVRVRGDQCLNKQAIVSTSLSFSHGFFLPRCRSVLVCTSWKCRYGAHTYAVAVGALSLAIGRGSVEIASWTRTKMGALNLFRILADCCHLFGAVFLLVGMVRSKSSSSFSLRSMELYFFVFLTR